MKLSCKLFGHHIRFIDDPENPLDITRGCTRCKDPSTFKTLVHVTEDPTRPGYVQVTGLDRLTEFLESYWKKNE